MSKMLWVWWDRYSSYAPGEWVERSWDELWGWPWEGEEPMREASSSEKSMALAELSLLGAAEGNLRKESGTEKRGGTKRLSNWEAEEEGEEAWALGGGEGGELVGGGDGRWKPSVGERTWGL